MRARRAVGSSMVAVTFGAVTATGSATPSSGRSNEPSERTTSSAAGSCSSRRPERSDTTAMRRPRRTSAAFRGRRFVVCSTFSSANSSAASETARLGRISAPKKRV